MLCRRAVLLTPPQANSQPSLSAARAKHIPHSFNRLRTLVYPEPRRASLLFTPSFEGFSQSEAQPLSSQSLPHSFAKTAGCLPASFSEGRYQDPPTNPFRMIEIQISNKTKDLKSFRIIDFRKTPEGGPDTT